MKKLFFLTLLLCSTVSLGNAGDANNVVESGSNQSKTTASETKTAQVETVDSQNPEQAEKPKKPRNPQVTLETSMGDITLELFADKAPKTVANFLAYVDEGFYNDTIFHRVVRSFVIQGGGFDRNMQQKPITRPTVENESNNRISNDRGTIAMARLADPHSASSQFYINIGMNLSLDYRFGKPGYTVFGKVVKGMDVAKKINKVKTEKLGGYSDVPEKPVILKRAYRSFHALP